MLGFPLCFHSCLTKRLHFYREHSREIVHDGTPTIASVSRDVYLSTGGAEVHARWVQRIDRHCIPQHVHITIALRQTVSQRFPFVSARAAAVDAQSSIRRKMLRVAL